MVARRPQRVVRQRAAPYLPPVVVVDCSVSLAWYLEGERTDFTDSLLEAMPSMELWVPALWTLEFANALFAAQRRRRLDTATREMIVDQATRLPFNIDPYVMPLRLAAELAARYELTPYDAAYLELARRRKLPLATLDAALVSAARTAGISLVTDSSIHRVS